jgi:2-polyprenyl-3-methyl-5-hydroxy-6-metoxy-1,4-benzoquinol methylase
VKTKLKDDAQAAKATAAQGSPASEQAPTAIEFEAVGACPVCGQREAREIFAEVEDYLYSLPGKFRYVQCVACRLVYQDPRPTIADLPKCYADYHTHEAEDLPLSFMGEWTGASRWIRGGVLASKYGYSHLAPTRGERLAACLLDILPPVRNRARCYLGASLPAFAGEGRALDIGTGGGRYAASLKRLGWRVTGVEFDPTAAANTAARYGLNVLTGTLEDARFASESFDFISMFHVIEHLPDPLATLRECHRVLRPGRRIMLRTPNFDSLTRREFGKFWRGVEAPRHLCLFNGASLKHALQTAGFRVVRATTIPTATRYYVQSSMLIKAAQGAGDEGARSVEWTARRYNLLAAGGRLRGQLLGDELHVEAIR